MGLKLDCEIVKIYSKMTSACLSVCLQSCSNDAPPMSKGRRDGEEDELLKGKRMKARNITEKIRMLLGVCVQRSNSSLCHVMYNLRDLSCGIVISIAFQNRMLGSPCGILWGPRT